MTSNMRRIKSLDEYGLNESVVGKYTTLSQDEIDAVLSSGPDDLGDSDTTKRAAIVKALENAMTYFDPKSELGLDIKSSIISAAADEDVRKRLHNLAKTFASSLKKIRSVEVSEIEPVSAQLAQIIQP